MKTAPMPDSTPEARIPPAHLRPETSAWWLAVQEEYELEPHHVRILTLAAEAWDRGQEARETIDTEGISYLDRFGQPKEDPRLPRIMR